MAYGIPTFTSAIEFIKIKPQSDFNVDNNAQGDRLLHCFTTFRFLFYFIIIKLMLWDENYLLHLIKQLVFVFIVMEIVGKKWRTAFGIGYQIFFAFGYMILGGIAYIWRDWHHMMVTVAFHVSYYCYNKIYFEENYK